MKNLFSKTGYQKGKQCLKALYLSKYHSQLRDPLSPERKARFDEGSAIGVMARQLFPGGILVRPDGFSRPTADHKETLKFIQEGATILYESAFIYNSVIVYNDLLVRVPEGWHLYEVKSNQLAKDHYIEDLALQAYVLQGAGIQLAGASLIHLRIPLEEIQPSTPLQETFIFTDFTEECNRRHKAIEENIREMQLTLSLRRVPQIVTGEQCDRPYTCEFKGHCFRNPMDDLQGLFSSTTNE